MGYVFYFLLTKKKPYHRNDGERAHQMAWKGKKPFLKESVRNSKHPFDVAVRTIMDKCLELEPEKRPSSKEVRKYLHGALIKAGLNTTLAEKGRIE